MSALRAKMYGLVRTVNARLLLLWLATVGAGAVAPFWWDPSGGADLGGRAGVEIGPSEAAVVA